MTLHTASARAHTIDWAEKEDLVAHTTDWGHLHVDVMMEMMVGT